ncbi:Hypothetical predicted protein [Mytilus galloprovincialis]|uniref:Uncharacterized protein n=1 Tax=Mytilus galloprovincialis TaxID=29158 RepID=A0A8B6FPQ0_MYTGA|nr:Hypothetical predicted protein [Mytilus galloprovincialis]
MSFVTVIACLASISIVMQEAYAQDCATPKISTCTITYNSAVAGVGGDKNTICSAANTYLDCLNKVFTDCKLDSNSSSSFISQTIAVAKQALSKYGCGSGNGAGSLVFNLVTMMSGLTMSGLSLLLEGVLPLSEKTSVGCSVFVQGVELVCIDVPHHRIYLKSDLITGLVIVGVRPNLPVEGVTLLPGNDLARNKVVVVPIVTSQFEPMVDFKSPEHDAELYPAFVVTRAMARKQQDENLQEDKFDYMDLSYTFLADIEGPDSLEKAIKDHLVLKRM